MFDGAFDDPTHLTPWHMRMLSERSSKAQEADLVFEVMGAGGVTLEGNSGGGGGLHAGDPP